MPEIRLQFVLGRDPLSALIGWFSAGHLSHVDAVLPDGRLFGARNDRVGGQPPGVWDRPPDYARWSRRVTAMVGVSAAQRDAFLGFLRRQRGTPYDRLAILGFFVNRDWRDDGAWMCSELQARALEVAGIVPRLYLPENKVTPVALALLLSALPAVRFVER